MTLSVFRAVFSKELIDSLRDRRSIMGAMILPIVGPLMFATMFTFLAEKHDRDKPAELAVIGGELAPSLIGFLEENDVEIKEPPGDPDTAVRDGDVDAVLVISEGFADDFRAGRRARVELILDSSNEDAEVTQRRIRTLLRGYASKVGNLRLLARGVAPDLAAVLDIERVDLATPKRRAAQLLGMIPMFAFLAAFMGGMNVAIDTTAGERERRSLEPLLINPAPRLGLVLGKWAVTALYNIAVAALTLVMFYLVIQRVPLHQLGLTVDYGLLQAGKILLLVVPLALFSAALLMVVSIFAKSFKEAQTYLSAMVFVPMLPSFVLMINPMKAALWMMCIPTFGQNLLVTELMRGEPISPLHVAVASVVSLVCGLIGVAVAARLFQRERIIFGH